MTTFPRAKRRLRSSASWLSTQVKLAKQLEACVGMYMGAKFVRMTSRCSRMSDLAEDEDKEPSKVGWIT